MPQDPFFSLIPDARAFLGELAANNRRDWFLDQKHRYDADLKTPATLLLDQIAHDIGRQIDQSLTPKLFRAHRDVRFSKDKTPYHTHLHMMWTLGGPGNSRPALFLGVAPDYVRAGGGIMQFDKTALPKWRDAVTGPFGDQVQSLLHDLAATGLMPDAPQLKRVPPPYAPDHPQADLLRRKGLGVWHDMPAAEWPKPLTSLRETFGHIIPLIKALAKQL